MLRRRFAYSWFLIMLISCTFVVAAGLGSSAPVVSANHESSHVKPASKIARQVKVANITVPVYVTAKAKIQQVPLEQYVLGVVAAEMPDRFAGEALKAQAIAARTYILHKMLEAQSDHSRRPFYIKDSISDQVYLEAAVMERRWTQANDRAGLARLKSAVQDTRGLVVTYRNKPIDATYFSTSNGYTENSQDYWGQEVPYLQSVASPWDPLLSNRYKTSVSMTYGEMMQRLGIKTGTPRAIVKSMRIVQHTDGKRIKSLRIANRIFSGREFREKLALRSSHFSWSLGKERITITTFGNGHGVGLSQWGAHGMALKGMKAQQILKYYYRGVKVANLNDVWPKWR